MNLKDGLKMKVYGVCFNQNLKLMLFYYFQEEVGDRPDIISDVFKEMVEKGRQFSKQDYFNGLAFQREFQAQVHRDLSGYDIILNLSTLNKSLVSFTKGT